MNDNEIQILIDGYLDMLNNYDTIEEKEEILRNLKSFSSLQNFKKEQNKKNKELTIKLNEYKEIESKSIEDTINFINVTGVMIGNYIKDFANSIKLMAEDGIFDDIE